MSTWDARRRLVLRYTLSIVEDGVLARCLRPLNRDIVTARLDIGQNCRQPSDDGQLNDMKVPRPHGRLAA
jgi:hypothetical protein